MKINAKDQGDVEEMFSDAVDWILFLEKEVNSQNKAKLRV